MATADERAALKLTEFDCELDSRVLCWRGMGMLAPAAVWLLAAACCSVAGSAPLVDAAVAKDRSVLFEAMAKVKNAASSSALSTEEKLRVFEQARMDHANRATAVASTSMINSSLLRAWYTSNKVVLRKRRSGTAAVSAIVNDEHKLIMCTIPKIDSTSWRKVMLYLEHPELYSPETLKNAGKPDQHNLRNNGVKIIAQQTPAEALRYYNNPDYLKVFHTRNPMVRVLSAWISKNNVSANPIPFAANYSTFDAFVKVSVFFSGESFLIIIC